MFTVASPPGPSLLGDLFARCKTPVEECADKSDNRGEGEGCIVGMGAAEEPSRNSHADDAGHRPARVAYSPDDVGVARRDVERIGAESRQTPRETSRRR